MKILSVNIGKSQAIDTKSGQTGIYKKPQNGAVKVERLGLSGDAIIDLENHGGPDQAVYLYGQPDYDWWSQELGREMMPGLFGENLTISGLESAGLHIGDRFLIGDVILEATSPRIPCVTLCSRMDDPKFAKKFISARRTGIYCRVLKTGEISAGMEVRFLPFEGVKILANDFLTSSGKLTEETMRSYLQAPIHEKSRAEFETKLRAS